MKLTIAPVDGTVIKNNVPYVGLDLSAASIPKSTHTLQWQGDGGWLEHIGPRNEPIEELPEWAESCLAIWQTADDAANAPLPEPQPPTREQQEAARQAAYSAEADPIAMQMLRDEATKEEWLAKIDEIKARYPYPEE
jgi:hypothetical protein